MEIDITAGGRPHHYVPGITNTLLSFHTEGKIALEKKIACGRGVRDDSGNLMINARHSGEN